jgi:DNA-binding NtrC family response regulator
MKLDAGAERHHYSMFNVGRSMFSLFDVHLSNQPRKDGNSNTFNRINKESTMEAMKIMLVDDEERFLSTTQKLLHKKGIDAVTATSGAQALELLNHKYIQVVILDVKMPGMDGNETLKEIKRRFPLVEVIMLTGHATVESAIDGLKSGATDYLMKPTEIDDLIAKAREAFRKRLLLEEKILMAQSRQYMKSPREILKQAEKPER